MLSHFAKSFLLSHLLSHDKVLLGLWLCCARVTSDGPKEGTEDCEGIGREMERVAERMGGTTKWPYNDSDCLDAVPWFGAKGILHAFFVFLHINSGQEGQNERV